MNLNKVINKKILSYVNLESKKNWSISNIPQVPTIIDIGIGEQGTKELYSLFPNASYVFIDPVEECREAVKEMLTESNNYWITVALGSTRTTASINVANKPSRSSFFHRPVHQKIDPRNVTKEKREVPIERLDDVIKQLSLKTPYGIKIDTEGYELEVLKGAKKTIQNSLFVILELHYWATYAQNKTPNLQALTNYMNEYNFSAYYMLAGENVVFMANQLLNNNS